MDAGRLKKIPVFADLDDAQLHTLSLLASEVSVPEGKDLVREGDYSYDMLAIEEGTASVTREGEHLADLGPGDIIGEIGVMTRAQRNATVTATSPMLLVTLDRWDMKKLTKSSPQLVDHLQEVIAKRS